MIDHIRPNLIYQSKENNNNFSVSDLLPDATVRANS